MVESLIWTQRIERLRGKMHERGLAALLCLKPQSTFYLSGFNPILYSHPVVVILPIEGDPILLIHALRDDHARQSTWIKDIRLFGAWATKKTMGMDWLSALRSIFEERGVLEGAVGIDGDFLPINTMRQIEHQFPELQWQDASQMIMRTRMAKDESEIKLVRAAACISDVGMAAAIEAAARRGSEREISVQAMAAMNREWLERFPDVEVADFGSLEGGVHNGLWCYCLTGERTGYNCDNPTTVVPAEGDLAVIVIWTNCNGLHAENERALAVGRLNDQKRDAFKAVLEIREESQAAIRAGVCCADVYNAAKAVYERLGYGEYLPGRIGHGLGLGGHEPPSLGPSETTVLEAGTVLAFEPNLRIAEFGGLQHSDTLLVTDRGFEFLTTTQRGYIQV